MTLTTTRRCTIHPGGNAPSSGARQQRKQPPAAATPPGSISTQTCSIMKTAHPTFCVSAHPSARLDSTGPATLRTVSVELKTYGPAGWHISRVRLQIPSSVFAKPTEPSLQSDPVPRFSTRARSEEILRKYPGINSVIRSICAESSAPGSRFRGCGLVPQSALARSPFSPRALSSSTPHAMSGKSGDPNRLPFGVRSA
jgi:hypothetical protein